MGKSCYIGGMRLCGREFNAAITARTAKALRSEPSLSRSALSPRVCQWMQQRTANGRWKGVSRRKALLKLHRHKLTTMPAAEKSCFSRSRRKPSIDQRMDGPKDQCSQKGLGEVSIVAMSSRYSKLSPLNPWAVYAQEIAYQTSVKKPIEWMLLTTVKSETFEDACQRLS